LCCLCWKWDSFFLPPEIWQASGANWSTYDRTTVWISVCTGDCKQTGRSLDGTATCNLDSSFYHLLPYSWVTVSAWHLIFMNCYVKVRQDIGFRNGTECQLNLCSLAIHVYTQNNSRTTELSFMKYDTWESENNLKLSPPWEANRCSATQEIPWFFWSLEACYCVYTSL
jgi:hypothetical protein